jgi:flagellar protein FlgJ
MLKRFALAAQHARRNTGYRILASTANAQAIQETGFGVHIIGSANNYFGLKVGRSWKGPTIEKPTWEHLDGKDVQVIARFRAYPDMEASFQGYGRHLVTCRIYQPALEILRLHPDAWEPYTREIAGHWATDPNYADSVVGLIRSLELRGFDQPVGT